MRHLIGIHSVTADAVPFDVEESFSHSALDDTLSAIVSEGRVDYPSLVADNALFLRYAATLAIHGPTSDPDLFPTDDHRLAYYINAYNTLVLLGVLDNWPIESVHDVSGTIRLGDGAGFFWGLRFELDGDTLNLFDLEHDVLRHEFNDARIHAAINCASVGCPILRPFAFVAETLSQTLDQVAHDFATQPPHVTIDDENRQIRLSAIYDWFASDFVEHAQLLGVGDRVIDWIAHYAGEPEGETIRAAVQRRYEIVYVDYDWRLNRQSR